MTMRYVFFAIFSFLFLSSFAQDDEYQKMLDAFKKEQMDMINQSKKEMADLEKEYQEIIKKVEKQYLL